MRHISSHTGPLIGGLHRKVSAALLSLSVILVVATGLFSQHIFSIQSGALGQSLAITEVQLVREKLLRLIGRELVMVQRFAELSTLRLWLAQHNSPEAQARFFSDAEGFRLAFTDQHYFAIVSSTGQYYQADVQTSPLALAQQTLHSDSSEDAWYIQALRQPYALHLFTSPGQGLVLRISVPVLDHHAHPVGLVGTTMQLERFMSAMVTQSSGNAVNFFIDAAGQFCAHPDPAYHGRTPTAPGQPGPTIYMLLKNSAHSKELTRILDLARKNPGSVELMALDTLDGPRLMAFSHIPELNWTAVSSVDTSWATYISANSIRTAMAATVVGLLIVIGAMSYRFERQVLSPLMDMADRARYLLRGQADLTDYSSRRDEIGELAQALERMARTNNIRITELEQRLAEHTRQQERTASQQAETQVQPQTDL
ncbi:MAG: hypothetical protein GX055_08125 [Desulfovibrionales bacterium]|nr:hypothetical protein [Desulfovibrionales bacterium]